MILRLLQQVNITAVSWF